VGNYAGPQHPGTAKNIAYDANGNIISVTNSCGATTFTWDVRNGLAGMNGFKPDCTALTASFKYDAVGRRIEKMINGTTTKYLYDGLDIIQEIEGGAPITPLFQRGEIEQNDPHSYTMSLI